MNSGQKYLVQPPIINCSDVAVGAPNRPRAGAERAFLRSRNTKQLTIEDCQVGFPIRTSRDQRVLSPPPGLSQSATSFIASCCQGIHQTPLSRLIRSRRRQALLRAAVQTSTRPWPWMRKSRPGADPRQEDRPAPASSGRTPPKNGRDQAELTVSVI